jgi:hypothetical protein
VHFSVRDALDQLGEQRIVFVDLIGWKQPRRPPELDRQMTVAAAAMLNARQKLAGLEKWIASQWPEAAWAASAWAGTGHLTGPVPSAPNSTVTVD